MIEEKVRKAFARRDRIVAELAKADAALDRAVDDLSHSIGLKGRMRREAARLHVASTDAP